MAWKLQGTYVATCACSQICPCPVDGKPTGPNGTCLGGAIFHIQKGTLDGQDLSGVNFAFYNFFPSNLTSGNWKMALVVDEGASDEQAKALERIISGQEGGPFGEFVPLIAEMAPTARAKVTFSGGKNPSGSIGGTQVTFDPIVGPDGSPVTIKGAPFAFAPEYAIGKGSGKADGPFGAYDQVYGESADFEYSDVMAEAAPKGRG